MPDVFDQIGGGTSVAAAPKGDVFDQLPAPAQAPTGDHAESAYFKSHPGMDPLAIHGAFMQLRGQAQIPQPGTAQQFSQQVADQQGGLTHFGNAMGQALANPIQGAVGLVAPQTGMNLRENNALQYGPQTGAGGFLGAQAGNLVNAPLAMSGVGRVLSAAEAMGNKRIDVAQERAAGQDVSGASELARVAGTGALDLGVNTLANKIGGKAFAGIGKAVGAEAAPAAGQVLKTLAKRFGVDLAANEAIAHGQIAAQNLIDSRPVTEGMGKESLVSPVVQTAAFAVGHGGSDMLKSMRERSAAKAAVQPTGQENARPNEGQQGLVKPEGAVEVGRETHTADDRQVAKPTESDSAIGRDGRLEGDRTPKAQEEPSQPQHNDARPYNGDPNNDGHAGVDRQNPGQTSGENRVMDVFDRVAEAEPQIAPTPGEKNVLDAHMRSVDREIESGPQDNSLKMRQPERMRDQHPDRLGGGKDMTDYVARISDDAATAPLIGSMTEPHGNFVRARVPIDQLHGLGDTGADVVASKGGEQKNPAVSIPSGTGEEGHLDLIDGNHSVEGLRQAGATHAESYVPESMIGKHGIEAVGAQKPAVPQPIVEQKTPLRQMMARRQGSARPGFVAVPDSKYVERDVKPAAEKLVGAVKDSLDTIHRAVGTGASWSVKDRDSANHVSQALAEHDRAMAQIEHELKPHRDAMEKWTPDAKAQWVDAVEGSGISPDPKHQDAADFNLKYNQENIDRGKLVGLNTKKWSGDWIGHLAEFPDRPQGSGTGGTLAGAQNFLKGRSFDKFSDFKKFVEDHGGRLKYENPIDMLLAKQGEVQRSIAAREAMYKEDNHGQLKWVPDGEKPPEGFEQGKLKDPLAEQERRQILPSSTVARLAGMSHFDAQNFLKGPEVAKQSQYLRPGTDVPSGYSYSGERQTGTYHGNENVANIFNNLVTPGLKKSLPVLSHIAAVVRGGTSLALNLSGAHYGLETLANAGQATGRAIDAAVAGNGKGLRENLKLVNPLAANKLGKQAREEYKNPGAHPELSDRVNAVAESGSKFTMDSVLDKNYLADAKKEWAAGNKVGAGVRVAKHLYDNIPVHHYLFHEFVPNLKAAAAVMSAGQAEAKGLTGEAKQRYLSLAHDDIDGNLGMVQRNRQFQHKAISDLMDAVMLAPKYIEGRIRNTAAATRDSVVALRDVAKGKRPVLTPAMATAAGHLAVHATLASLTQIAMTTAITGKPIFPSGPMDLLRPRTGRKDDQGREERLTMPTPVSAVFGLLSRGSGALASRVAPVWHTIANELSNVDENNVKIHEREWNTLGGAATNVKDMVKYAAKNQSPFIAQGLMEDARPGQPGGVMKKLAGTMAIHTSFKSASGAEQEARSALFERARANPMTQDQYARQQERGRVLEEMKNKNPDASKDLAADLRSGKLTNSDRIALARQRKEPEGLTGELKKMQAQEIMDRVWPKMTADEKQKNQWIVRGMIGRSQTLTPPQKQELWGKIKQEMKGVK